MTAGPPPSPPPGDGTHRAATRGTVIIDTAACKGCELCLPVCPPGVLELSGHRNAAGYRPAVLAREGCTGCGRCVDVCPDLCITAYVLAEGADA